MQLFTFLNTKSNDFFEKVLQMCGYKRGDARFIEWESEGE